MNFLDTPDKRDRRVVHLPLGRFGEAIEQARAALFRTPLFIPMIASHSHLKWITPVASDDSSYVTVSLSPYLLM